MSRARKTPVIVGVGDIVNRCKRVEDAIEPLQLMLSAIDAALDDTGLINKSKTAALRAEIDSVDVVKSWTWPCDYPRLIADRLKLGQSSGRENPLHLHYSEHGGNQPAKLLDEAARRISTGESKVAVVTGGEALASLTACAGAKKLPPPGWTAPNEDVRKVFSPTTREIQSSLGARHSIGNPIHIYPLYENSFRAYRNQSLAENHSESAQLYADFAKVAASQPYAWNYGAEAETEESIATITKRNRMICLPYPLLMNAFNTVNLAAACIVTSTDYAQELGIPSEKWIYPLGGGGTSDSNDFWLRPSFWWSPSISKSLDAALDSSTMTADQIDLFDFYSCFPIVPKLACQHLGLPILNPPKPITLIGGLTSFGGAGNNYSLHAITEMTRQLRQGKGKNGLVLANGGWVTYEYAICLSRSPRVDGLPYPDANPLPPTVTDVQIPRIAEQATGDATIETYTVEYNRDGSPGTGFVIGRLRDGRRFVANHADERTLRELCSTTVEPIGRQGHVRVDEASGRNLFAFGPAPKL